MAAPIKPRARGNVAGLEARAVRRAEKGWADDVLETGDRLNDAASMATLPLMLGVPVLGWIASKVGKLHAGTGKMLNKPVELLSSSTADLIGKNAAEKLPFDLGKKDLTGTLTDGVWIGGSAIGSAHAIKDTITDNSEVNTMTSELRTAEAQSVAASEKKRFILSSLTKAATQVASWWLTVRQIKGKSLTGGSGALAGIIDMAALVGVQKLADSTDAIFGPAVAPAFNNLNEDYKQGHAGMEDYEKLLYAACPQVTALQDSDVQKKLDVQTLAKQFADEKVNPEEVLNNCKNGKLVAQLKAVATARMQEQPVADATPTTSFAAKVKGVGDQKVLPKAQGAFTEAEINRMMAGMTPQL